MENPDIFIERKITTACIVSTEFLHDFVPIFDSKLFESPNLALLCVWVRDYYEQYGRAPGRDIEIIYSAKLSEGLRQEQAEWIEGILEGLSDDYELSSPAEQNASYLLHQSIEYFKTRQLRLLSEDIQFELDKGNQGSALDALSHFIPINQTERTDIDPFGKDAKDVLDEAFKERQKSLIRFPKALGEFWNQEMVRGGFVALMGAEKRGKSMLMLEIAMRAMRTGSSVAFFQAGDMTEGQQLRRIAIYLTQRSDQERYCNGQWLPTVDCVLHQINQCDKDCREDGGLVHFRNEKEINFEALKTEAGKFPKHRTCYNCHEMKGSAWLRWSDPVQPLTAPDAYRALRKWGRQGKGKFMLSTYANNTLTVKQIRNKIKDWERRHGFIPDVVVIDYADLLIAGNRRIDFRHQKNEIWQDLRNMSQELNCLVVTATQISARGYNKELLTIDDFSEDKRQSAHVTALYGINQTAEEKRIGIWRINEIVVREADFDSTRPVSVLHRLQIGKPYLGSWR